MTTAALTQSFTLSFFLWCFAFRLPLRVLMSLKSQKFFSTQTLSYGVSAASLDRMKDRGWTTMGAFAFSTSSPPGASVEEISSGRRSESRSGKTLRPRSCQA